MSPNWRVCLTALKAKGVLKALTEEAERQVSGSGCGGMIRTGETKKPRSMLLRIKYRLQGMAARRPWSVVNSIHVTPHKPAFRAEINLLVSKTNSLPVKNCMWKVDIYITHPLKFYSFGIIECIADLSDRKKLSARRRSLHDLSLFLVLLEPSGGVSCKNNDRNNMTWMCR